MPGKHSPAKVGCVPGQRDVAFHANARQSVVDIQGIQDLNASCPKELYQPSKPKVAEQNGKTSDDNVKHWR